MHETDQCCYGTETPHWLTVLSSIECAQRNVRWWRACVRIIIWAALHSIVVSIAAFKCICQYLSQQPISVFHIAFTMMTSSQVLQIHFWRVQNCIRRHDVRFSATIDGATDASGITRKCRFNKEIQRYTHKISVTAVSYQCKRRSRKVIIMAMRNKFTPCWACQLCLTMYIDVVQSNHWLWNLFRLSYCSQWILHQLVLSSEISNIG